MATASRSASRDKVRAHRAPPRGMRGFVPFQNLGSGRAVEVLGWSGSPVSRWRWQRVLTPSRTRSSSTRFRLGMRNETWRDLDRRGWRGLCRQAATRGHRPRRPIRCQRLDRCLPVDHRLDDGTAFQASCSAQHPESGCVRHAG